MAKKQTFSQQRLAAREMFGDGKLTKRGLQQVLDAIDSAEKRAEEKARTKKVGR